MICHFKVRIDGEEKWVEADKVFAHYLKKHFKKEQKTKDAFEEREENFKVFIREKIEKGHSGHTDNNVIATELINAGWKDFDIGNVFKFI